MLSDLFDKNFVKAKFLLKSWFHEFFGEREFRVFFHTAQCGKMKNLLSPKNISSNQLFSNFFSKNGAFTKFLPKKRESKFPELSHCALWKN